MYENTEPKDVINDFTEEQEKEMLELVTNGIVNIIDKFVDLDQE